MISEERMSAAGRPVALVTGATGGIGEEIARVLSREGYDVVIHHFTQKEAAVALAGELGLEHCLVVEADLRVRSQVHALMSAIAGRFNRLDVVVNNAGVMEQCHFSELSEEVWSDVIATNLSGTYRVLAEAQSLLARSDHPAVVNVSSQGAYSGLPNAVAYSASKAGILGLTRALARDLGPHVRVNAVAPGPIATPMTAAHAEPAWIQEKTSKLVMGRFGIPAEVAGVVRFLVSDEASYITGQTISVNGGGVMP